jgi:hypothetical protein
MLGLAIGCKPSFGMGVSHKNNVGEFRKTHHPRNVKFDKVHETCFAGAGNSRFLEAWNL